MTAINMPENYRPQVGETLFVSLYNQRPILVTIIGYRNDERFSSEVFDYIKSPQNKSDNSILKEARFYKNVPLDRKHLYVAMLSESEFMGKTEECELEFFFDPESALNYIQAVESGETKARYTPSAEFVEYKVCVERFN